MQTITFVIFIALAATAYCELSQTNSDPAHLQTAKRLGIWMDHSNAHLIEVTNELVEMKAIESDFTHQEKERSQENLMHNKEQYQQGTYYKKLGEVIQGFDEVILFGPTDAKVELFDLLSGDQHFSNIKMEVKQTEKMTEPQELAFVRAHFSKK